MVKHQFFVLEFNLIMLDPAMQYSSYYMIYKIEQHLCVPHTVLLQKLITVFTAFE